MKEKLIGLLGQFPNEVAGRKDFIGAVVIFPRRKRLKFDLWGLTPAQVSDPYPEAVEHLEGLADQLGGSIDLDIIHFDTERFQNDSLRLIDVALEFNIT